MTAALEDDVADDARDDAHRCHGEAVLNDVRTFLSRFVTFPTDAALDAATLWVAHTHVVDGNGRLAFDTTPRLAFISDEPASGKTRAMEMVCELAHKGKILIDVTHPSFAEEMHDNMITCGLDEMDILFGTGRAKSTLRSLLNAGYRRKGATWTRANRDEKCIFGPVVMAGLAKSYRASDDLKALRSRTIQVTMTQSSKPEEYRPRLHDAMAADLRKVLARWAVRHAPLILEDWPELPEGVEGRTAELWEPLIMVANAAGGHWPTTAREACQELALGNQDNAPEELPLSQQLLGDLRAIFAPEEYKLTTVKIVQRLYALPGAPWRRLWPNEASAPRELSTLLGPEVAPIKVRDGEQSLRGYARASLEELWADVPARVPDVPDVPDDY